jgi:PAS domain S-box-containing protein
LSNDEPHANDALSKTIAARFRDSQGPTQQFLYETAPIGLAFLSPECRYLQINQHLTEICGISVEGHIGRTVRECVPALADAVEAIVASILETGEPVTEVEVAGQKPGDAMARSWMTYWHPVRDADHTIIGVNVAANEITERKRAEAALRASEQQFRTLANSIPQIVWMSDADGAIFWSNRQLAEFSALGPEEIAGQDWLTVLRPDRGSAQWTQALAAGARFEMEVTLRRREGREHPFLTRVVPLHGAIGVDRWLGTHIDISEIREREAHIQLIADELSHRSKNQLAVVMAIAQQTMGQTADVGDYHARLALRLSALAKSNDLLMRDNWQGASLHDLVRHQLEPFGGADQSRVEVEGPPVKLHAGAVQYLGLALHELATNASKYGALSGNAGRVSIRWTPDGSENVAQGREVIRLHWSESGGPPVVSPERHGFGSVVMERIVPHALDGDGTLEYPPEGVRWVFAFPAGNALHRK